MLGNTTTSALLRSVRTSHGATQRALASAAKVRQPGIAALESGTEDATISRMEQLLSALGTRLSILPTRLRPVWMAGHDVRQALANDDERTAWREVIQMNDDLRTTDPATAVALAIAPCGSTGEARFDALIAAVAECALAESGAPLPTWLNEDKWFLEEPWDVEPVAKLRARARGRTPQSIARHGVFLDRSVLESV